MAAVIPCKRAFSQASIREMVFQKQEKHLKQRQDSVVLLKHMNPQDKKKESVNEKDS